MPMQMRLWTADSGVCSGAKSLAAGGRLQRLVEADAPSAAVKSCCKGFLQRSPAFRDVILIQDYNPRAKPSSRGLIPVAQPHRRSLWPRVVRQPDVHFL
eukprot:scaffold2129_cov255-Pinguiococcus_pyrenoidosus.AAC.5